MYPPDPNPVNVQPAGRRPYNPVPVRPTRSTRWPRAFALAAALSAWALPARGQALRSDPIVLGDGRVAVGGNVSATTSCARVEEHSGCGNDTGFFNFSDYEHSTLRMLRLTLNASVRAHRRLSFLAEVRSENGDAPVPYALYARIRPWANRSFDLQVGRIPPTFGAFARRAYVSDNLLIGFPLAYQYLTSLRPDALPATPDDLLRMRGRGWLSSFPVGDPTPRHGLPLATAFRWDTGVQAHLAAPWGDAAVAVTNGSLGNPRVRDDNSGKQFAGRVTLKPLVGLVAGLSASRAPYLAGDLLTTIGRGDDDGAFAQQAWGADLEYSRDYYLVRSELIISRWTLPTAVPTLRSTSWLTEGSYKLKPGLHVAARLDRLTFSEVAGTTRRDSWDAPVTRVEVGGGYLLRRNVEVKLSVQRNVRDGGRVPRLTLGAAQLAVWF